MNVIKQNAVPEIKVKFNSLGLRLIPAPFRVKTATIIMRQKHKNDDRIGETNQLKTIR